MKDPTDDINNVSHIQEECVWLNGIVIIGTMNSSLCMLGNNGAITSPLSSLYDILCGHQSKHTHTFLYTMKDIFIVQLSTSEKNSVVSALTSSGFKQDDMYV